MIARIILKELTGQGQGWSQDQSNQPINQTNNQLTDWIID